MGRGFLAFITCKPVSPSVLLVGCCSARVQETATTCRERCGGQGYLSVNKFGAILGFAHAGMTAEGDNRVLMQKVQLCCLCLAAPARWRRASHPEGHRGMAAWMGQGSWNAACGSCMCMARSVQVAKEYLATVGSPAVRARLQAGAHPPSLSGEPLAAACATLLCSVTDCPPPHAHGCPPLPRPTAHQQRALSFCMERGAARLFSLLLPLIHPKKSCGVLCARRRAAARSGRAARRV